MDLSTLIPIHILTLFIGLFIGTLVVLFVDMRLWEQRVQKADSERRETKKTLSSTQGKLHTTEKQLAVAEQKLTAVTADLAERDEQIYRQRQEAQQQQRHIEAANHELEVAHAHLNEVTTQVDELNTEAQKLGNALQTAEKESQLMRESLERYNEQLETARTENQEVCQRLAVSEVEMKHLRQALEEALVFEERAQLYQTEKDALSEHLVRAKERISELKAQIEGTLQQLTETQLLRKRLAKADAKLKATESQIELMHQKLTAVQSTLEYTGKNQLQIIRGVGPTYARRLNDAGIRTLNDLARCTPDQLTTIIKLKSWQNVEPEDWIREAKALTIKLGEKQAN